MGGSAAVTIVRFGQEHLEPFRALAADPLVLRFTRFPDPLPEGFAESWLARYEAGRAAGTMEGFAILAGGVFAGIDRKSTRLNSSHIPLSRMPSSA